MDEQGPSEVYPESPTEFFAKMIDGQANSIKDAQGSVPALMLHRGGGAPDQPGKRLP